jgi:hypothetical protein
MKLERHHMKFGFSSVSLVMATFALSAFGQADPAAAKQVGEILRMADRGVSEKTMLSHIYNSPGVALSGQDVGALHKRGLSITIISAMLEQQQRTQAGELPSAAPTESVASIALSPDPDPIIYPTPAREAVPLTSPDAVYLSPYAYCPSPVIITGSSYYGGSCYGGSGFCNYAASRSYGCGTSSYGYGSRYGCNSTGRCRF